MGCISISSKTSSDQNSQSGSFGVARLVSGMAMLEIRGNFALPPWGTTQSTHQNWQVFSLKNQPSSSAASIIPPAIRAQLFWLAVVSALSRSKKSPHTSHCAVQNILSILFVSPFPINLAQLFLRQMQHRLCFASWISPSAAQASRGC